MPLKALQELAVAGLIQPDKTIIVSAGQQSTVSTVRYGVYTGGMALLYDRLQRACLPKGQCPNRTLEFCIQTARLVDIDAPKNRVGQMRPGERRIGDIGIAEIGVLCQCLLKVCTSQYRLSQIGS